MPAAPPAAHGYGIVTRSLPKMRGGNCGAGSVLRHVSVAVPSPLFTLRTNVIETEAFCHVLKFELTSGVEVTPSALRF